MVKIILLGTGTLFLYFLYVSRKFRNEFRLIMLFGKKGSGKSTFLTRMAIKYNRLGYHVFSNSEIYGAYKLDTDQIGYYDYPEYSVLLIDEVGMIWDNRDFKSFKPEVRDFFKLQRHKKLICYLASQTFDVDKKLRDLTDDMYLMTNFMGIFSIAKKINKKITIHNASDENSGESFLTETYSFDLPFFWKITYIPRYVDFFNSFEFDPLPPVTRERYKYYNDAYLFKLTHYAFYLKDRCTRLGMALDKKLEDRRLSFKLYWDILAPNTPSPSPRDYYANYS